MERVRSKHLFEHLQLTGQYDQQVQDDHDAVEFNTNDNNDGGGGEEGDDPDVDQDDPRYWRTLPAGCPAQVQSSR